MIVKIITLLFLWSRTSYCFVQEPLYETDVAVKKGMKPYESPINVEAKTYMELVEKSSMFVDNTLFIVNAILWAFPTCKRVLLVGPRKWGKSMTLDMLRSFLDVHVDEKGDTIPREKTTPYTLFHKGEIRLPDGSIERLQKPPLISSQVDIMDMFQGRIPVIFFSFKDLIGYTHDELRNGIVRLIQGIFYQHRYMPYVLRAGQARAFKEDRKQYLQFLREEFELMLRNETLDYLEHIHNLEYLTEMVCQYRGRKPYFIIDDYDGPILNLIRAGNATPSNINIAMEVLEGFVADTVIHNSQVAAVIMSGNFVPKKPDWLAKWSFEFIDGTLKNTVASEYIGFNKADVDTLLEKNNIPFQVGERVHKWYGNYKSNLTGYHFYNPHSIANFLKRRKFRAYVNTSEDQLIINCTLQNRLETSLNLISGQTELVPDTAVIGQDSFSLLKGWPEYFYFFCFRRGYLGFHTLQGNRFVPQLAEYLGMTGTYVKVPNNEMASIIANWMFPFYKRKYNIDDQLLRNASVQLLHMVESESTDTSGLDGSLQALYTHCSATVPIDTEDKTSRPFLRFHYRDTIHPILNCVTLKMQCLSGFQVQVFYNKLRGADIVVKSDLVDRVTVIELQLNAASPQDVLNRSLQVDRALYKLDKTSQTKFIGINVATDCGVSSAAKFEKKIIIEEESIE